MPQDRPPYSKLIFITSNSDKRADNFRIWLYQRLKYAHLPVRTHGADEAIGGGGFTENSIQVADPVLAIYSHPSDSSNISSVKYFIDRALELRRNVFLIIFEKTKIPETYRTLKLYDFRRSSNEVFAQLRDDLLIRNYPKLHSTRWQSGADLLSNARSYSDFRSYYYVNIFDRIHDHMSYYKISALQDLSDLDMLSGLVKAVMIDDPDEEVRAQAALCLSKYDASSLIFPVEEENRLSVTIDTESSSQFEARPFVFISYSHRDAETQAQEIANELQKGGVKVWIDSMLTPGLPVWTREIEKAITKASYLIVLLSPGVHESEWVEREISYAEQQNKTIIPVMIIQTHKPLSLTRSQALHGDPIYTEEPEKVIRLLLQMFSSQD